MEDKDSHIKKMAKLLYKGATMLDKNCPRCGTILFRMKNKTIICPKCEVEVVIVKNKEDAINRTSNQEKMKFNANSDSSTSFFDLNNLFASFITNLSQKLRDMEDMTKLGAILNNINLALDIMQKLRNVEKNSNEQNGN